MLDIRYEQTALKDLKVLEKANKKFAEQVVAKVNAAAKNPEQALGEQLKGRLENGLPVRRLVSGNYRIVIQISDDELSVLDIKDRKEVYR
ncbi:type II toxin-antitoxin system RelE/ParE family toxin [Myxococcota bacterium]